MNLPGNDFENETAIIDDGIIQFPRHRSRYFRKTMEEFDSVQLRCQRPDAGELQLG